MRFKCIIFDEVIVMLDLFGRKEVMKIIKRFNKEENIIVIYIMYFMEEVVEVDRVVVMEKGKKILEGIFREVFSKIKMLKEIGLDVFCMIELFSLLIEEGINISSDILIVDEMVMELC